MDQNLGNFLSFMDGEDLFTIERPRKQRKTCGKALGKDCKHN